MQYRYSRQCLFQDYTCGKCGMCTWGMLPRHAPKICCSFHLPLFACTTLNHPRVAACQNAQCHAFQYMRSFYFHVQELRLDSLVFFQHGRVPSAVFDAVSSPLPSLPERGLVFPCGFASCMCMGVIMFFKEIIKARVLLSTKQTLPCPPAEEARASIIDISSRYLNPSMPMFRPRES